jgi:hypothetical protein
LLVLNEEKIVGWGTSSELRNLSPLLSLSPRSNDGKLILLCGSRICSFGVVSNLLGDNLLSLKVEGSILLYLSMLDGTVTLVLGGGGTVSSDDELDFFL